MTIQSLAHPLFLKDSHDKALIFWQIHTVCGENKSTATKKPSKNRRATL
jgi:hypothetical protein